VLASTPPTVTKQPVSTTAIVGATATFLGSATGTPAPALQWYKNGNAIPGANAETLTLASIQGGDAGTYHFTATNVAGSATSSAADLVVYTEALTGPNITAHPANVTVGENETATFSVAASGSPALSYQWRKNGNPIAGATSPTLTLTNVQNADTGRYSVVVTNSQGTATSNDAVLAIGSPLVGIYYGSFATGDTWALQVYPDNTAIFIGLLSSRNQAIVTRNIAVSPSGQFSFGSEGTMAADGAPGGMAASYYSGAVNGQIASGNVTGQLPGLALGFTGTISPAGSAAAVAGYYNAVPLIGTFGEICAIAAPNGTVVIVAIDTAGVRGGRGTVGSNGAFSLAQSQFTYTGNLDRAANSLTGSYQGTGGAVYAISSPSTPGGIERLAAVSTRGLAGTGAQTLISGFVVSGNAPQDVLVRGIGPGLARHGLPGALANPRLKIFSGSTLVMENGDWGASSAAAQIADAAARTGAAALDAGSADAAILARLQPGAYTAQVSSDDNTIGVALAEVYDASSVEANSPKLIALSTRGEVGAGDNILIVGLVVMGNAPKKIIIRGVGPTLQNYGVEGVLADPVLRLYQGATLMRENDDWSASPGAAAIVAAGNSVGLSALPDGSKDAALLLYLPPGGYTVQLRGASDTTGVGLVEVYEVP
jgi:hypothetical protein